MGKCMDSKERFLKACRQEPVDRPPVWMMRQAGRYLPEYRAIRRQKTTLQMMKDPETACEITLQPVNLVGVDAAILYSDILMVPEAMGLKLDFVKEIGPVFENPITSMENVEKLLEKDVPSRCPFVYETLHLIRKKIPDFPLLGFAGAPFTVATYMVGGDGSYDGNPLKKLALEDEKTFRYLMEKLTQATTDYLAAQIGAGADCIQLFDTWAGSLSSADYVNLALPYEKEILTKIQSLGAPTILYIKGGAHLFEDMLSSTANVLSIDWRMDLGEARRKAQGRVGLQGNLDPAHLYGSPAHIEEMVSHMLDRWGKGPGYIMNLGHGIMPDVPVPHAKAFVEASKRLGVKTVL